MTHNDLAETSPAPCLACDDNEIHVHTLYQASLPASYGPSCQAAPIRMAVERRMGADSILDRPHLTVRLLDKRLEILSVSRAMEIAEELLRAARELSDAQLSYDVRLACAANS